MRNDCRMKLKLLMVVVFLFSLQPTHVTSESPFQIDTEGECKNEIHQYCKATKANSYGLLACLHNEIPKDEQLSVPCQHYLWQAKKNLTRTLSFSIYGVSGQSCLKDISGISDCQHEKEDQGPVFSCLLEYQQQVKDRTCLKYLNFLKMIIFSDYRLVYKLVDACNKEIDKLKCGRLENYSGKNNSDQGSTISCLAESFNSLDLPCKHEILKISELQSQDWNGDRQLFLACREDRYKFCREIVPGSGNVYKCLFKKKMNPEMSIRCREKLRLRQKLQQEDIYVNYGFSEACMEDIKSHCEMEKDTSGFVHAHLSKVILCLEDVKLSGNLKPECLSELKTVRYSLLEDHKINPEVVTECTKEIQWCEKSQMSMRQPYIIHCLMDLTRKRNINVSVSSQCMRAVEALLIEVDIRDDADIDPALLQDCQVSIQKRCEGVTYGKGRMIDCLMLHVNKKGGINEECLNRLMEIQYFVSRDFKVSRRFVKACKIDSKNICSSSFEHSINQSDVLSCLYRNRNRMSSEECFTELEKLLMDRARTVDLPADVQEFCLSDLISYCPKVSDRDEEMYCLEENFDSLSKDCQKKLSKEIEQEEELPLLMRIFVDSCESFWNEKCNKEVHDGGKKKSGDEDESEEALMMKCLIEHKNDADMPTKCRDGVEHHQLMTMKNVDLSVNFRQTCRGDIKSFCPGMPKKLPVVKCLSEHVFNDSMQDAAHRIGKKCRRQLRFELLQLRENVEMDDEISSACKADREQFCRDAKHRGGEVIECLRSHQKELNTKCRGLLFKGEVKEAIDASIDYMLMTKCKKMIKLYCMGDGHSPEKIFECLKQKRHEDEFDETCNSVILNRLRLRAQDIRLNPVLLKNCKKDIEKNCLRQMKSTTNSSTEVEGVVIQCLRNVFVHKIDGHKMSVSCEAHITELVKETALDYLQDAALVHACGTVIQNNCAKEAERHRLNEDGSEVEECLKRILLEKEEIRDANTVCLTEVVRRMSENKIDIQIDPVLNRQCSSDIRTVCGHLIKGEGRVISCLLSAMPESSIHMSEGCRRALKDRWELWNLAVKVAPPENIGELYTHIQSSSAKTYFQIILFLMVCVIFFGGLFCGRVTKRITGEMKRR